MKKITSYIERQRGSKLIGSERSTQNQVGASMQVRDQKVGMQYVKEERITMEERMKLYTGFRKSKSYP